MERERECAGDAAAYVLGALDRDEAERFHRHAAACPECRAELQSLAAAARLLPLSAPQLELPAPLRRRVLAEVRAESKAASARTPRERSLPARRPVFFGGALALAAVLAAMIVLVPGGSGTRVYRAAVSYPSATASLRVGAGRPELVVRRLPAPPAGKVYEVWVARGRTSSPAGALFSLDSAGGASVRLHHSLRGITSVMVTAEPLGGSATPTGPAVIMARLS